MGYSLFWFLSSVMLNPLVFEYFNGLKDVFTTYNTSGYKTIPRFFFTIYVGRFFYPVLRNNQKLISNVNLNRSVCFSNSPSPR